MKEPAFHMPKMVGTMFAVVRTGGKQYRVAENDVILVEKLTGDAGETIVLDDVLAVGSEGSQTLGTPSVAGASVAATVLDQTRGKKILVFKKQRRKTYRRTRGHRQRLTALRITEILTGGKKPTAAKKAEAKKAPETKPEAKADTAKAKAPAEKAKTAPAKAAPDKKPAAKAKAPAKPAAKPAAKKAAAKTTSGAKPAPKKPAAKKPAPKK